MAAKSEKDWWKLAASVPCSPSDADRAFRKKMFSSMDANGNGILSLAEVERYLKKLLGLPQTGQLHPELKDSFDVAKDRHATRNRIENEMLGRTEFLLFLADLSAFFYDKFVEAVVKGSDGWMSLKQFAKFTNQLKVFGVQVDPAAEFTAIDDLRKPDFRRTGTLNMNDEVLKWLKNVDKAFELVDMDKEKDPSDLGNGMHLEADGSISTQEEPQEDGTAALDLASLIAKLPVKKYESEDMEKRKMIWMFFDVSGNGGLTLGEVNTGLVTMLKADGKQMMQTLSPAIKRAFHAAKDVGDGGDDSLVAAGEEFRLLLVYLKRYFELLVMYDKVDTSDDRKLDREEFDTALAQMALWGVHVDNPSAEFAKIDNDKSGKVTFDEFAGWALKQGLDMDPSDNTLDEDLLAQQHKSAAQVHAEERRIRKAKMAEEAKKAAAPQSGGGDLTQNLDLRAVLGKLPTNDRPGDEERRVKAFSSADASGNGFLNLMEVHQCLIALMGPPGRKLTESFSPAITQAFNAAKDSDERTKGSDAECVSRREFKTLLIYLKRYFELYAAFERIDVTDDRRIDRNEFEHALPMLAQWGVKVTDADKEFKTMDRDGGGKLRFDEFAGWALEKSLDLWQGRDQDTFASSELAKKHAEMMKRTSAKHKAWNPKKRKSLMQLLHLNADTNMMSLILRLPCGLGEQEKAARTELFEKLDTAENGVLFLQDVDDGFRAILSTVGRRAPEPPPPCLAFAFDAMTQYKPYDAQYISRIDFRLFLCNLKWYANPAGLGAPQVGSRMRSPSMTSSSLLLKPL